jgi:hypothetical protein
VKQLASRVLRVGLLTALVVSGCGKSSSDPVSMYPGAKMVTNHRFEKGFSIALETTDPPEKPTAYYEKELGAKAQTSAGLTSIEAVKGGQKIVVGIGAEKEHTAIFILGESQ